MSKFEIPSSLETASPELLRRFIQDRKAFHNDQLKKSGVLSLPPQYLRNMAHTLGQSPSAPLALDSDDAEEPKVDTYNMTARFVITTSGKDRHGDIVLPRGCVSHLKNYTRNPRIFFAHKTEELPIASARDPEGNLALEILEDKIYSTAYFHGETRESELIFRLIARKELQACSIGFLPIRATLIEDEDEEDLIDITTGEEILNFRSNSSRQMPCLRFLEWDMIEWSVVPIPANQDALAAHLSRGHIEGEKLSPSIKRTLSSFVSKKKNVSVSLSLPLIQEEESEIETLEKEIEKEIEENENEKAAEVDKEKLDEVFASYKKETNMGYAALKKWSESACSKRASLSRGPINRNLELLSTPKDKWTAKHITWANKTIAFNTRMLGMPRGKRLSEECPWSKRDISLKNWAYDPGKTPESKKELGEEITHQMYAGPSPGVDLPLAEKKNPPAPPKDQITGSDTNKPNSASDDKGKITISQSTEKTLKNKIKEHNEKVKEKPAWAKTTLGAVKSVYRRGAGAFSSSHRPNMTRAQWAFARVNAFLYLCKNGKPENKKYITDNDLLHKDHPKYSKEKKSIKSAKTLSHLETNSLFGKLLAKQYKAVKSEVKMAMAVLLSLQEGLLPEKIKIGVYIILAKHYKLLDITSPVYRKISSLEEIKTMFPEIDIKEFTTVATNEENWIKSAMDELQSPPTQGKPKKKKKEDEDEEEKYASSKDDEEKAEDEDAEEKAANDEDEKEDKEVDEEEKEMDEEEKAEDEDEEKMVETKDILKSMSAVMQSMHECSNAHTELLKGLHEKMDECMKAFAPKEDKEQEEDEMKSILSGLLTLKSNQDALNRRLFEVTGKR